MPAEKTPLPESIERRLSAGGGVWLLELLSLCGWRVTIQAHPAGGLEAIATRGWQRETAAGGGDDFGGLAASLFVKAMRSSREACHA